MQVLVLLTRARGAVVTRDELSGNVWDGVLVGEDALTRAVGHVRRLAEWGGDQGFEVRTVPTIGYCLAPAAPPATAPALEPLLAILPFDNLSEDPTLRFLSEGVSEEILQTMARGTTIRLIGRSSSFQFRGDAKRAGVVRRELGATHVLDGAVRRIGSRVRVSAQLIETAGETVAWSDRFDFPILEIFEQQDRIAELVARALNRTFVRSRRPADVDAVAYELYLRGAEFCREIVPESQRQAITLLEAATHRAPNFADAWGELALARAQARFTRFERRRPGARDERADIEADAARARALDPACEPARLIPFVGGPLFDFSDHRRRFEGPRPSRLATTASPDVSLGVQLLEVGRIVEALEHFRQAELFDPLFQIQILFHALAQAAVGPVAAALERLDAAVARWPFIPFFSALRVCWAALLEDWPTVDTLMSPERLARFPLQHRTREVMAFVAACRTGDRSRQAFEDLREESFALGKSGLEPVLLFARRIGLAETLAFVEAGTAPLVDAEAPRRPDDNGSILLFLPFYRAVRSDPLFPRLCARLGLAQHWCGTDAWPTCADEFAPGAFQAACREAVAQVGGRPG
jgi:TolB-like protein